MAAKKAERIPAYVDPDGFKLVVEEIQEGFVIGWLDPEDGCVNAYIENEYHDPDADVDGSNRTATDTLVEHFTKKGWELPSKHEPFSFETGGQAKEALRIINAKLHYAKQNKPLPDWAEKALAAGWLPPKGWKP